MSNEELDQIRKDATTFVDELKDRVHEQNFIIKEQRETIKRLEELRIYKVVVDYLKEKLIESDMPIGEVSYIMSILNYAEDKECMNTYFSSNINEELKRALEVM